MSASARPGASGFRSTATTRSRSSFARLIACRWCRPAPTKRTVFTGETIRPCPRPRARPLHSVAVLEGRRIVITGGAGFIATTLARELVDRNEVVAIHNVHCAAIAGVETVLESPVRTMRVNVIGTYNALEAALATLGTLERFVDFSTSEVFGTHAHNVSEGHVSTIGSVGEARWTYAVSKLA